jgi:uncharacterized alkaline shock family protein YloU
MTDTATMSQTSSQSNQGSDDRPRRNRPSSGSDLVTDQGTTSIADSVVEKIAGMAAKEIQGVHAMGSGAGRAFGAIKEAIGNQSSSASTGVSVEVGQRQAAIDLDLIVDYGVSIIDVAQAVRRNVLERVERTTGLEVTEVNIDVEDVYLGDQGDDGSEREPRVR